MGSRGQNGFGACRSSHVTDLPRPLYVSSRAAEPNHCTLTTVTTCSGRMPRTAAVGVGLQDVPCGSSYQFPGSVDDLPLPFPALRCFICNVPYQDRCLGLRHHAITELAEGQASDATIMAIAGHVSRHMLEHYSHIRLDLKRKALEGLASRRTNSVSKSTSYDTNYDTTQASGHIDSDVTYRKEWSGREDSNLRPPGPEPTTDLLTCCFI
jgi:hypothetical protein